MAGLEQPTMSSLTIWDRPLLEECGLVGSISWMAWFPGDDFDLVFSAAEDGFPGATPDTSGFNIEKISGPDLREVESIYGFFWRFNPAVNGGALARCMVGVVVEAQFPDQADLAYLQTSNAICRGLARMGAVALFDMKAWRWWEGDEMFNYAAERNFAVAEHVSIFTMNHPVAGPYCHTRGLCKFARPEIFVTGIKESDGLALTDFLNELALRLALGKSYGKGTVVQLPHPLRTLPAITFEAFPDDSNDPEPKHQLGANRFGNASIRVVDFDEEVPEAMSDCRYLLSALRGGGDMEGWSY